MSVSLLKRMVLKYFILIAFLLFFENGINPPPLIADEPDAASIMIIANTSVEIDEVSKLELKNIYTGRTRLWPSGDKIILAYSEKKETHYLFLKIYIEKTPQQFINYWRNQIFTGKAIMIPRGMADETELVKYVSKKKGAIACVSSSQSINDGVKIISVK